MSRYFYQFAPIDWTHCAVSLNDERHTYVLVEAAAPKKFLGSAPSKATTVWDPNWIYFSESLPDEDCKGGRFFFKGVKEGDQVVFATEEELERQIWVNKLYTATGQSHKPVAPKLSVVSVQGQSNSLTRLQGGEQRGCKEMDYFVCLLFFAETVRKAFS